MEDNEVQNNTREVTIKIAEPKPGEERVGVLVEMDREFPRILQALLFASDSALPPKKIKEILGLSADVQKIKSAVDEINQILAGQNSPFEIVEVSGGYQFRTLQKYHPWIKQLFRDRASRRLSPAGLETLAIIAYKQPVSKSEIEAIRGIQTDGTIKTLLEKGLVTIAGRSDVPGRPLIYSTTKDFLRYFGLNRVSDLPKIEELKDITGDSHILEDFKRESETEITAHAEEDIFISREDEPEDAEQQEEDILLNPEEQNENDGYQEHDMEPEKKMESAQAEAQEADIQLSLEEESDESELPEENIQMLQEPEFEDDELQEEVIQLSQESEYDESELQEQETLLNPDEEPEDDEPHDSDKME
ncbi:MAG: SMC-Scp complex subunit ScpB [bacterium]